MTLESNQRVRITGDGGTVVGRVESVQPLADLLEPGGMLREMGVDRVAWISYHTSPDAELMFTALEIGGEWFDLKRQRLELEVIGAFG